MIGQTVGNYRIGKLLGEGGMGSVFLAEHPGIGRKVAVKVLRPELAGESEIVQRFFNEARAANTIRHPGIVEIFDFGQLPSGSSYLVMEYLEGTSLAERIRRGPVPPAFAVNLAAQAANALAAAHDKGIVHRDLKPDNLFVIPDPRQPGGEVVKILDFGIAKLAAAMAGTDSVRTRTGVLMGTPMYMSPEQCRGGREVDHRTDIYSLGVILYEMLCGRPPFVSDGQGELIHLHIAEPPPPLRGFNPAVSAELEVVVLKTLAKEPGQRFESMAAFERALRKAEPAAGSALATPVGLTTALPASPGKVITTLRGGVTERGGTEREPSTPSRRRGVALVGVAVVVAVVGGSLALGTMRGAPQTMQPTFDSATAGPTRPPAVPEPPSAPPVVTTTITSTPSGARVVRKSDGALLGSTPFTINAPATPGTDELVVELPGYVSTTVIVPRDQNATMAVSLRPSEPPRPRSRVVRKRQSTPSPADGVPPPLKER